MFGFQKRFILPFLLLLVVIGYDTLSLRLQPMGTQLESTSKSITTILDKYSKEVLKGDMTQLYGREILSTQDLKKLKSWIDELDGNHIQAQIYKDYELVFWTTEFSNKNFCRELIRPPFTGQICYAPFDKTGKIEARSLEKEGFENYFSIAKGPSQHQIENINVSLGKTFRPTRIENVMLLIYLGLILWLVILSIKNSVIWPLLILIALRVAAVTVAWTSRYSYDDLTTSLTSSLSYNHLDLLMDGIILFGLMFWMARYFIGSFDKKVGPWAIASLSFLHMVIFVTHIRLIQILVRSENTTLSIEDLSNTSATDLIVFATIVLLQLGIFHFGYSLFKLYKTSARSKTELYVTYGVSICAAVIMGYFLKLNLDPWILLLFLFCYVLLMDLFVDVKTRTITWIIWGDQIKAGFSKRSLQQGS